MKTKTFKVAFADSRNMTMYANSSNKGTENADLADTFFTLSDAKKYMKITKCKGCWVEDSNDDIVFNQNN